MPLKKDERKQAYFKIMRLLLQGENKQAFEAVACMCGEDTGAFWLGNYEDAVKAYAEEKAKRQGGAA